MRRNERFQYIDTILTAGYYNKICILSGQRHSVLPDVQKYIADITILIRYYPDMLFLKDMNQVRGDPAGNHNIHTGLDELLCCEKSFGTAIDELVYCPEPEIVFIHIIYGKMS